jgi:suppressor for copper-sensitivity B
MLRNFFFCILAALSLLIVADRPVRAAETPWASEWWSTDQGRLRLVAAAPDGQALRLGLEFQMAPEWKIYWRSPGDAGYPPSIDWRGSANLQDATLLWPAPERFTLFGLDTYGFHDRVLLPMVAKLADPSAPVTLSANVDYLTCRDICVPYQTTLTLTLPRLSTASPDFGDAIAAAQALVPGDGSAAGLSLRSASLAVGPRQAHLDLIVAANPPMPAADVFVEGAEGVVFGRAELQSSAGGEQRLRVPVTDGFVQAARLVGRELTVTVAAAEHRSLEARINPGAGTLPVDLAALAPMLALALLGGLVLNVMPCVLPVLSIKLLTASRYSGSSRRDIRLGFLATAAGVLISFLALAGVVITLKIAGVAVGWGLQFQEPLFLVFLAAVVTLFAGNMAGLFEIRLPYRLGGLATLGAAPQPDGPTLGSAFLSGVLATLLATPCSAPFLGTAVGFALAGGPVEILAIFTALGIGLGLPYLAGALFPGLVRYLPRPGRWMVTLRRGLALLLLGTSAWLLTVVAAQIGAGAALAVAVLLAAALLVLGLRSRRPAMGWIAAALLAAVVLPPWLLAAPKPASRAEAAGWVAFDRTAIDRLVADRRVVFVDVTADWCLTCQVNKRLVLGSDPVSKRLASPPVTAMRADWTRPSDEIAAYLRSFGRYGIPFNAVYGPAAPNGIALSELLSESAVIAALDAAAGPDRVGERAIAAIPMAAR